MTRFGNRGRSLPTKRIKTRVLRINVEGTVGNRSAGLWYERLSMQIIFKLVDSSMPVLQVLDHSFMLDVKMYFHEA
jgi:hypothetical protein